MASSHALGYALVVLAIAGLAGGIAGVNRGWAYAEQDIGPTKPSTLNIQLQLGWWRSTINLSSGLIPAALQTTGQTPRVVGVAAVVGVSLAILVGAYYLLATILDAFGVRMPKVLQLYHASLYKLAQLTGALALVLSLVLYITLVIWTHRKVQDAYGSDASVWPRPDWAFFSSVAGSICLMAAAQYFAPSGYEETGYVPI